VTDVTIFGDLCQNVCHLFGDGDHCECLTHAFLLRFVLPRGKYYAFLSDDDHRVLEDQLLQT
jgi:hypothetical protein